MNLSRSLLLVVVSAAVTVPATAAFAEEPLAPRADPMPASAEPTHPRDVGMRTAGQVMVTIGATAMATGAGVWIGYAVQPRCEFCGLAGLAFGGPVLGLGVVLTAIGAPLWAVGGAEVKGDAPKAARIDLHIGASSVGLSGSF